MMAHFLFAYALCGIWTALVISTTDLLMPETPNMGVGWTILFGVLWPVFTIVVMAVVLKRLREKGR
jgi:hypothetical protein